MLTFLMITLLFIYLDHIHNPYLTINSYFISDNLIKTDISQKFLTQNEN